MTVGEQRQRLRVLELEEVDDFLTQSGDWAHQLPPPGTSLSFDTSPYLRLPEVVGIPSAKHVGRRWWQTLGELAFSGYDDPVGTIARWVAQYDPVVVAATGGAANVPAIYDEGRTMRWIRSVFRGNLASGVEQFQWKLDWGIPGNDPTLGESEAGAFAQFLAEQWAAAFIDSQGSTGALQGFHPTSVEYTEVGVASWTQSSPKDKDGKGGDAKQEYPTAFYAYPVGQTIKGTTSSPCLPLEVSCSLTFDTDKRGPRGRGRIYLPPFDSQGLTADGRFASNRVLNAGKAVGILFDAVKGSTYAYKPLVVSMREVQLHEIKAIRAGQVPDSQRRRRHNQAEAYQTCYTVV